MPAYLPAERSRRYGPRASPLQRTDIAEGAARLDRLHAAGPGAPAFTFRQPFDAAGRPAMLDRERFRTKPRWGRPDA